MQFENIKILLVRPPVELSQEKSKIYLNEEFCTEGCQYCTGCTSCTECTSCTSCTYCTGCMYSTSYI